MYVLWRNFVKAEFNRNILRWEHFTSFEYKCEVWWWKFMIHFEHLWRHSMFTCGFSPFKRIPIILTWKCVCLSLSQFCTGYSKCLLSILSLLASTFISIGSQTNSLHWRCLWLSSFGNIANCLWSTSIVRQQTKMNNQVTLMTNDLFIPGNGNMNCSHLKGSTENPA